MPTNEISATGSILLRWPSQVTILEDVKVSIRTARTYASSYTVDIAARELTFTNIFFSTFNRQITIEINPVTNPKGAVSTEGFSIYTFDDANQLYPIDMIENIMPEM